MALSEREREWVRANVPGRAPSAEQVNVVAVLVRSERDRSERMGRAS